MGLKLGKPAELALLSFMFFSFMVAHEVVIEGMWESFTHIPDGIALYITLFQFTFVGLGALTVEALLPSTSDSASAGGEKRQIGFWMNWLPYLGLSVLVFMSTALSNHAVHYVQYPVKVVFKSSKLMPTMLVSTCIGNSKAFGVVDYAAALLLCIGTAGFAYGGGKGKEGILLLESIYGCGLLLLSVFADAFLPNLQQKVMAKDVSPERLMMKTNFIGAGILLVAMAVTGHMFDCIDFSIRHPKANINLVLCAVTLFVAVFCMTRLVKTAGSVFSVTVATLRKGATVIMSYLIFPKEVSALHVVSLILVASGLVLHEAHSQYEKARQKEMKEDPGTRPADEPQQMEKVESGLLKTRS
eukprot:CAMPEP_0118949124 /NCGR_PEP_ID=MMETSP1169-20130426/49067_1 /TAXON_ID=36882 /ORGANISM="Pyramimonas obovata, Strain CCMP722" /LENGTH=356 /DNA_ID=CAMNT_0006895687 /DNA_START=182 /DNA_END=1249 /DNA_ORIENTATION=+